MDRRCFGLLCFDFWLVARLVVFKVFFWEGEFLSKEEETSFCFSVTFSRPPKFEVDTFVFFLSLSFFLLGWEVLLVKEEGRFYFFFFPKLKISFKFPRTFRPRAVAGY